MAQLLEAGVIPEGDDALHQAYETALRLPKHADIFQSEQDRLRQDEEERQAREKAALAQRARSQAVSVRSSTPSASMNTNSGPKGLRDQLSEAFDAHMGGRV